MDTFAHITDNTQRWTDARTVQYISQGDTHYSSLNDTVCILYHSTYYVVLLYIIYL